MELLVAFKDIIIININKNYKKKKKSISSDLTFQNSNPILQYKINSVISFNYITAYLNNISRQQIVLTKVFLY